jgi:hypothetical protein
MIHFLHPKTMICPFELHPNTSGTGGAVAKDCPDQKHAVALALPFIPLLDNARRPRALALMRELRPEAADPLFSFAHSQAIVEGSQGPSGRQAKEAETQRFEDDG